MGPAIIMIVTLLERKEGKKQRSTIRGQATTWPRHFLTIGYLFGDMLMGRLFTFKMPHHPCEGRGRASQMGFEGIFISSRTQSDDASLNYSAWCGPMFLKGDEFGLKRQSNRLTC